MRGSPDADPWVPASGSKSMLVCFSEHKQKLEGWRRVVLLGLVPGRKKSCLPRLHKLQLHRGPCAREEIDTYVLISSIASGRMYTSPSWDTWQRSQESVVYSGAAVSTRHLGIAAWFFVTRGNGAFSAVPLCSPYCLQRKLLRTNSKHRSFV